MTFSVVVADARAVTFQWKFNGADIPGATVTVYCSPMSAPPTRVNTAVVVTNSAGSVTSAPAGLMLRRDPTVNTLTPPRLIVYSDEGGSVTVTPMKPIYNPGETVTLTATPITDSRLCRLGGRPEHHRQSGHADDEWEQDLLTAARAGL